MSVDISNVFIEHFSAEVHASYQRMGSKLRNMVRVRNDVKGSSTTFQRVGSGIAMTKSRHGMVPVMNVSHTPVKCSLQDYYAGDWVDRLDELKVSFDERMVIAQAGAYALGRKTDELIIAVLDQDSKSQRKMKIEGDSGLTKEVVLAALEMLGNNDVPDDGQRYALVGWKQWSQLLDLNEFKSADYVGADELPWRGTQAKRWLGTMWMPHSGLTKRGSDRVCHWFHKTAVAHASGKEVVTDITWHGDRASHFVSNMMSQGACLVDGRGLVTMLIHEEA
ncbi:MAG: hypothetical protein GDA50_02505 [Alphaproteobacteria bacterium GM202ARS2]|nr:hypothetical protein [Alphaproteobacteria bacterium GM202ARS2]